MRSRDLLARPRTELPSVRVGVPGLRHFGRYNYSRARAGLAPHAHRGAIEICYLVRGHQTYHAGGRDYRLRGGDVFVTFPDELHSTGGAPEEKGVLYWMLLRPEVVPASFLGLAGASARALTAALRRLPSRHFRGTPGMQRLLDGILLVCHQRPSPLRATIIGNRVTTFLLQVVAAARARAGRPAVSPLAPVLRFIAAHLEEALDVPTLAREAGLSVSRFKARFKEDLGVPPREYVLRAKVEVARQRLRSRDRSVADVAYELGFSSSQYFATVFKRFTGMRPSADRRLVRATSRAAPA